MFRPTMPGTAGPFPSVQPPPSLQQRELHDAITTGDVETVRSLLMRPMFIDQWKAAFSHVSQHKSRSSEVMRLLLDHPLADVQTALDMAVKHDDKELAAELVKRRVEPSREHFRDGSDEMRSLLWSALCKRTLYPDGADASQYTELDHALLAEDKGKVNELLSKKVQGKTVRDLWGEAVKSGSVDIQRALILTEVHRLDRSFRLHEITDNTSGESRNGITDPGVWTMLKQIPYTPPKHRKPWINFNGRSDAECRHIIHYVTEEQGRHPSGKFDYAAFQTLDSLQENVSVEEQPLLNLTNQADETHLIKVRHFGAFITRQLEAMPAGTNRRILLYTLTHGMSLLLRVKKNAEQQNVYVVKLYDPNNTTTHVRMASADLRHFEAHSMAEFISEDLSRYFYGLDDMCLMFVCPPPNRREDQFAGSVMAPANRTLTSGPADTELSASLMHLLLTYGFAGNLRLLADRIAAQPPEVQTDLLAAKNDLDIPGLFMALQDGHADVVKAFCELLFSPAISIPFESRIELLTARDDDQTPGLFMALQDGRTEVLEAVFEVLRRLGTRISQHQLIELLAARDADHISGLFMALKDGHTDTIAAYSRFVGCDDNSLSKAQRIELLEARGPENIPALHLVLRGGEADYVSAFKPLVSYATSGDINVELLAARSDDGVTGLYLALEQGHADTIKAYVELVCSEDLLLTSDQRLALLEARTPDGMPALNLALQGNDPELIRAFQPLVTHHAIPEQIRIDLLAARSPDGVMGLYSALQQGNADAIRAFASLFSAVPENERAAFLAACSPDIIMGLHMAMLNGHAEATRAVRELLYLIPEEERFRFLAARNPDGVTGLHMALQSGHADAVLAFGELLEVIPKHRLIELLKAERPDGVPGLHMAMRNAQAGAVQAFAVALSKAGIDPSLQQFNDLATARRDDGVPGLLLAMQEGHADVIRAYRDVIVQLPSELRPAVLAARTPNGTPALHLALQQGQMQAVRAFIALLELVPAESLADLLAARRHDGVPGLHMAMQHGHSETIREFINAVRLLPPEARGDVVAARRLDGNTGLQMALRFGHVDALRAIIDMLDDLPEEQRADIFTGRNQDQPTELRTALRNFQAGAIRQFGAMMQRFSLPVDRQAEQMIAAAADLRHVLRQSGQNENARAAVEAYIQLCTDAAQTFSAQHRSRLLKEVRDSHRLDRLGGRLPLPMWKNEGYYERLKISHPEFYHRFKQLKAALSS